MDHHRYQNVNGIAFTGIANLTGGTLNDGFKFPDGGSVWAWSTAAPTRARLRAATGVTVNLTAEDGDPTGGIANIQNVTGSPANDTITGNSASNVINGEAGHGRPPGAAAATCSSWGQPQGSSTTGAGDRHAAGRQCRQYVDGHGR